MRQTISTEKITDSTISAVSIAVFTPWLRLFDGDCTAKITELTAIQTCDPKN